MGSARTDAMPAPVAPPGRAKVRNSVASRKAPRIAGEASTCGYMFSYRLGLRTFDAGVTHFRLQTARTDQNRPMYVSHFRTV